MKRTISVLCLCAAFILCAEQSLFAQAGAPLARPPATRPAATAAPEEYEGTLQSGKISKGGVTVEGVNMSFRGKGSESARQAQLLHDKARRETLADRHLMVANLPKDPPPPPPTVVKEVRYVTVQADPAVIYVDRPVYVYRYNGYRWGWFYP